MITGHGVVVNNIVVCACNLEHYSFYFDKEERESIVSLSLSLSLSLLYSCVFLFSRLLAYSDRLFSSYSALPIVRLPITLPLNVQLSIVLLVKVDSQRQCVCLLGISSLST
jgi:hypothetical protein